MLRRMRSVKTLVSRAIDVLLGVETAMPLYKTSWTLLVFEKLDIAVSIAFATFSRVL